MSAIWSRLRGKRNSRGHSLIDARDPKRTFAAAASESGKLVKEEIDGGNLAVPGDDEIGSGVN